MDEIIEYCGAKKGIGVNPGLIILLAGAVLASIDMICFYRKNAVTASCIAFFIVLVSLIFTMSYWNPSQSRIVDTLKKHERKGTLNTVIDDFSRSKPYYSDSLRLGEKYIFGRHTGVVAEISDIYVIGRVRNYFESTESTPWFTVKYLTRDMTNVLRSTRMVSASGIVICEFSRNDNTDENWNELCSELAMRNSRIKYDRREFTNVIRMPDGGD